MTATHKKCWKCQRSLPLSHFGNDRSQKDGLCGYCKDCRSQMAKDTRQENRPEIGETLICKRCGYSWTQREIGSSPKVCPSCKSPYWGRDRKHQE